MEAKHLDFILKNLIDRITELEDEVKILKGNNQRDYVPASITHLKPIDKEIDKSDYPDINDAPEWQVEYIVKTSEGILRFKLKEKGWTEKQAIFLGRNNQLFNRVNMLVKEKKIKAKWSIAQSFANKIE